LFPKEETKHRNHVTLAPFFFEKTKFMLIVLNAMWPSKVELQIISTLFAKSSSTISILVFCQELVFYNFAKESSL
jgi:hypothetical protein